MTTPLAPITTCLLCGERFDGGVEIVGKPEARLQGLIMKLAEHVSRKHQQQAMALAMQGGAFTSVLLLSQFKSSDEGLNAERDRQRWQVHQQTLNARFSDESLRMQCGGLAARILQADETYSTDGGAFVSNMLYEAMASIRDALEEPNRY